MINVWERDEDDGTDELTMGSLLGDLHEKFISSRLTITITVTLPPP
jgi:hypothetical protein